MVRQRSAKRDCARRLPISRAVAIALAIGCAPYRLALAEESTQSLPGAGSGLAFEFNPNLLAGGVGSQMDLSRFAKGNPLLAGVYRADIVVNGQWTTRRDVRLAGSPTVPCIDADLLRLLKLDDSALTDAGRAMIRPVGDVGHASAQASQCSAIEQLVANATATFEMGELRLEISVAQAGLSRQPKGYVPPESWDYGVNAAVLNYNANAFRTSNGPESGTSLFVGLSGGLNLDRWRLRHSGSYNRASDGHARYQELGTYVATDIPEWNSSLLVGDTYTGGQLFPSFRVRGVTLAKDIRMLPDSQRGYAPVIRGVANGNAKVEVKQNNVLLYSTSVPAGPFVIDDLYPTGYGGDLQVIVTESDGSQRVTNVPYSSLPQLLREGSFDYSLNAGQLLGYTLDHNVVQGSAQYGLSNDFTVDGGVLLSQDYASALVGGAWNTAAGAFQVNVTGADFRRSESQHYAGWSLDGSWAKVFPTTNTNLNFAAYRYSSSGYYGLEDAMRLLDRDAAGTVGQAAASYRIRNKAVLSINQTLDTGLSIYVGATSQDYWDYDRRVTSYQAGFYKQIGSVQLSFNAVRTHTSLSTGAPAQSTYTLGLTIPLGADPKMRNNATASYSHDTLGGDTRQVGFFGSYGERGELSYGVSERNSDIGNTLSVNGAYHGKYATVGATASTGSGFSQQSVMLSGGIVGADGHLVFAPYIGDTVGLVHVSGAEGLNVATSQASEIDSDGYTLLPYLAPYSMNSVELDISKAPLSARFDATSATVAPHAGSVVLLNFKRLPGYTLMLSARKPDGSAVPFGSSVYSSNGTLVGSVGQAGRVEAASDDPSGSLRVAWGDDPGSSCLIRYDLPRPPSTDDSVLKAKVVCEPFDTPKKLAMTDHEQNDRSASGDSGAPSPALQAMLASGGSSLSTLTETE